MVKDSVSVGCSLSRPSTPPRLGHVGERQNLSLKPNRADANAPDGKRLWLVTTLVASAATASLIGIGFLAAQRAPADSPVTANAKFSKAALPTPALAGLAAPRFTGAVAIEPVEVTEAVALRGALYTSLARPFEARPTAAAADTAAATAPQGADSAVMAATGGPFLPISTALAPSAATGRAYGVKPSVLGGGPVRLASLSPSGAAGSGGAGFATRPPVTAQPEINEHNVVVAPGDTIGAILGQYGVGEAIISKMVRAMRPVFSPRSLRAGQEVGLSVRQAPDDELIPLELRLGTSFGEVTVKLGSDGEYTAALDGRPAGTARHYRTLGAIEGSLYGTARAQKVPDSIIVRMMHTHSYDVDFQREIHRGDRFEMFYGRGGDGDAASAGRGTLLFSSLTTGGKKRGYYRFTTTDGETDYYSEDGVSAKKPLMRTPIDGARISSNFGMRRHPILGYSRMHTGTDFAAAKGTPILAAGDGKVDFAGRNGGYGNYIRIAHDNGVKTAYAHLSRFAKRMKKGRRVRQGQVIGFVGSTGRSTGPHLHYEIIMNGKKVNPLKVKIAGGGRTLKGKQKAGFDSERARIDELRRSVPTTTLVAAARQ